MGCVQAFNVEIQILRTAQIIGINTQSKCIEYLLCAGAVFVEDAVIKYVPFHLIVLSANI